MLDSAHTPARHLANLTVTGDCTDVAAAKAANMNWYCVQIAQKGFSREADIIFRDMLRHERCTRDASAECKVYHVPNEDGGHCYYFSPDAAQRYSVFVNFWNGAACSHPADLLLAVVA